MALALAGTAYAQGAKPAKAPSMMDKALNFVGNGPERVFNTVACAPYRAQNYPARACGTEKKTAAMAAKPAAAPPAKKAMPGKKPAAKKPKQKSELSPNLSATTGSWRRS